MTTLSRLTEQALDDRLAPFEHELQALRSAPAGNERAGDLLARYDAEYIALGGAKNPAAARLDRLRRDIERLAARE